MIIDVRELPTESTLAADVAVVGAGPAGITCALELADRGFDVVLLESGRRRPDAAVQDLGDAIIEDPQRHASMSMTTRRHIGGASAIWGGRCVPFDPIDFEDREFVSGSWPVAYTDMEPWFQRACDWFVCGRAVFDGAEMPHLPASLVPGLPDGDVRTSTFERWSLPTNFGRVYRRRLRTTNLLRLITGLTCTQVVAQQGERRVEQLVARSLDGHLVRIKARRYVLACGGLETTRLLMASGTSAGYAIGDHSGQLGRWYMGHIEGSIANVRFTTPPSETRFDYERDIDGVWVRRRISISAKAQRAQGLPNVVGWLANPELPNPSHQSGVLSLAYLLLDSPVGGFLSPPAQRSAMRGLPVPGVPYGPVVAGSVQDHLRNIALDAKATTHWAASFGAGRFLTRGRRLPGFFVPNPENVYPLQYHGEHLPAYESRVELDRERDALGMPRLRVNIRFSNADVDGIVRAHQAWDDHFRRSGCGALEYRAEESAAAIRSRLGAGFHQSGTARVSLSPQDGVLSPDLAVHGFDDLYVASSAAFVTSGQANSTFMIVVFALRLVAHLAGSLRR